jgi:uncharacterized protein Smg (DUF494 family)
MNERIIEIILYLVTRLQKNDTIEQTDVAVLTEDGYSDAEIGAAFRWISGEEQPAEIPNETSNISHRVLHRDERVLFEPPAWGLLQQFVALGIITNAQLEDIIDNAMLVGFDRMQTDDVKRLVASVLLDTAPDYGSGKHMPRTGLDTIH